MALRIAATLRPAFPDGVVFVNLAPLHDPALVLPTIARALGVIEAGGQPLGARVAAFLAAKHALLLLDNYEQVVVAAPVVADLLANCPHLTVLATSRVPLHVRGEHKVAVPPLTVPDLAHLPGPAPLAQIAAVALFVARAREVKADFAVSVANGAAVAEICARLDGLPLAIELAAARVKLFPPPALLRRLAHRLEMLVGGACDLPERQRTLRATIDWSYGLLQPDEQALFARLSVFRGGGTLEAIEAICNPEGARDMLARVEALVGHSLLQPLEVESEMRVVMLETLREYAHDQLEARGQATAARWAHARYYLELAEEAAPQLATARQELWLGRLEREHDNLRAALGWLLDRGEVEKGLHLAGTLSGFWHARSHFGEGRRWLEAGLARTERISVGVRMTALRAAGILAMVQGDQARTMALMGELLPLTRAHGDPLQTGQALTILGMTAVQRGAHVEAARYLEESLSIARAQDSRFDVAQALYNMGLAKSEAGADGEAIRLIEDAHSMFRELGHTFWRMNAVGALGYIGLQQVDRGRAQALLVEYLALAQQLEDKANIAAGLEGLAALASAESRGQHAARLFAAAQRLREKIGGQLMSLRNRTMIEGVISATRAQVGEDAWRTAWDAGHALSAEQAIAAGLEGARRSDGMSERGPSVS